MSATCPAAPTVEPAPSPATYYARARLHPNTAYKRGWRGKELPPNVVEREARLAYLDGLKTRELAKTLGLRYPGDGRGAWTLEDRRMLIIALTEK